MGCIGGFISVGLESWDPLEAICHPDRKVHKEDKITRHGIQVH
jgi:hypothetical protein